VLILSSEVAETKKDVVATGVIKEGADVSSTARGLLAASLPHSN
jgi:hypothetical protein